MHYRALGVPVAAGVGATIDFLAGHMKRAPGWMQRIGMEWVFRVAQEPRRLFGRYMKDLWVFGQSITRQWWQMQFRSQTVSLPLREKLGQPFKDLSSEGEGENRAAIASEKARLSNDTVQSPCGPALDRPYPPPSRFQCLFLPQRLDLIATLEGVLPFEEILHAGRDCLLQMAKVEFIDSTGIGQLIQLQKRLRAIDRHLVLLAASP